MRKLLLAGGGFALVDDQDFELVSSHCWNAAKRNHTVYASRASHGTTVYMHREILQLKKGEVADHIDGDGLNNQRHNLRKCTASQNIAACCKRTGTSSQYKGVSYFKRKAKWQSYINKHGKRVHLGYFTSESMAAVAYNQAALRVHGQYARLNKVGCE